MYGITSLDAKPPIWLRASPDHGLPGFVFVPLKARTIVTI